MSRPRARKERVPSVLEQILYQDLLDAGMGEGLEREYLFHPKRKWRADFAYPRERLLIEIEGGAWSGGRHTRGAGFEGDCEKYNAVTLCHYRLLRFTGRMIKAHTAIEDIRRARGLA